MVNKHIFAKFQSIKILSESFCACLESFGDVMIDGLRDIADKIVDATGAGGNADVTFVPTDSRFSTYRPPAVIGAGAVSAEQDGTARHRGAGRLEPAKQPVASQLNF